MTAGSEQVFSFCQTISNASLSDSPIYFWCFMKNEMYRILLVKNTEPHPFTKDNTLVSNNNVR